MQTKDHGVQDGIDNVKRRIVQIERRYRRWGGERYARQLARKRAILEGLVAQRERDQRYGTSLGSRDNDSIR